MDYRRLFRHALLTAAVTTMTMQALIDPNFTRYPKRNNMYCYYVLTTMLDIDSVISRRHTC